MEQEIVKQARVVARAHVCYMRYEALNNYKAIDRQRDEKQLKLELDTLVKLVEEWYNEL
jgi:hypothetical protein